MFRPGIALSLEHLVKRFEIAPDVGEDAARLSVDLPALSFGRRRFRARSSGSVSGKEVFQPVLADVFVRARDGEAFFVKEAFDEAKHA